MKMIRKHPVILTLVLLLAVILLWTLWGNTALMTTEHSVQNQKIPASFDGFRIAQVSDLHNAEFGQNNETLLTRLEETQPDMIAITGDLVDSRQTNLEITIHFIRECVKIAPTYYVPGNHEARIPAEYEILKAEMEAVGITVLENKSVILKQEDASVALTGLMDPDFGMPWPEFSADNYHIVLSHRPELLDVYDAKGFDLVFSGHAHGGQFRLPLIGGLFAPHQGFFPEYDSGLFTQNNTTMVVSRGLGNSLFPLRFNNRPELMIITLKAA